MLQESRNRSRETGQKALEKDQEREEGGDTGRDEVNGFKIHASVRMKQSEGSF